MSVKVGPSSGPRLASCLRQAPAPSLGLTPPPSHQGSCLSALQPVPRGLGWNGPPGGGSPATSQALVPGQGRPSQRATSRSTDLNACSSQGLQESSLGDHLPWRSCSAHRDQNPKAWPACRRSRAPTADAKDGQSHGEAPQAHRKRSKPPPPSRLRRCRRSAEPCLPRGSLMTPLGLEEGTTPHYFCLPQAP